VTLIISHESNNGKIVTLGNIFKILFEQKHTKKWQVVFWINSTLLLYLTLMPSLDTQISYQHADKIFHFIGFGAFALFCGLAFPKLSNLWVISIGSLLGIVVEIIQSFLPHRGFSYADMLADLIGIVTAVTFLWLIRKIQATQTETN